MSTVNLYDFAMTSDELVQNAFEWLASTAIESSGRVVWIGSHVGVDGRLGTIGPSLYDGTAGLSFAFALYAAQSGQDWPLEIATKSIQHSLDSLDHIDPSIRHGLYSGWVGIVYVAALVASQTYDSKLRIRAMSALEQLLYAERSNETDIMVGVAGSIGGLCLTSGVLGEKAVDLAYRLAEQLQRSASIVNGRSNSAWMSPSVGRGIPLTGLSHGAAGIGWALMELWNLVHEPRLYELAERAFAYEDSVFDPVEQNWPDYRYYPNMRTVKMLPPPFRAFWCHGAGGIALSRIRAFEIAGVQRWKQIAHIAARTHRREVLLREAQQDIPLNLCHGLAGDADILQICSQVVEDEGLRETLTKSYARLLGLFGTHLIGKHSLGDPGLMLGVAGIAVGLMRGTRPDLTSPLMLRPL